MQVRICEHITIVSALKPGEDAVAGQVVEVDSATASHWIGMGWAVAADEPVAQ